MILNYLGQNSILDLQVGHKCSLIFVWNLKEKKNLLTRLISRGIKVTTVQMVGDELL